MKVIAQFFSRNRCPNCNSSNIQSKTSRTVKETTFAQIEKSESERFVCVDCDKWFIDSEGNKPGSGGRSETGTEVIDGNPEPIDSDAELPQKS